MPSKEHELPIYLFEEHPELLLTLVQREFGLPLPAYDEMRTESENWGELVPSERRVDLAFTLRKAGVPLLGFLFESQRFIDERKKSTWLCYLASFHATLNMPRFETNPKPGLQPCPVFGCVH